MEQGRKAALVVLAGHTPQLAHQRQIVDGGHASGIVIALGQVADAAAQVTGTQCHGFAEHFDPTGGGVVQA